MLSCITYNSLKSLVGSVFNVFPESDRFFLPAAPLAQANIPLSFGLLQMTSWSSLLPPSALFPAHGQGQAGSHHSSQIPWATPHFPQSHSAYWVVLRLTTFPSSPGLPPPSFFAAFFLTLLASAAVIVLFQERRCRAYSHGPLQFCADPSTSFRIYCTVTLPWPLLATPSVFMWSAFLYPSFPVKPFLLFIILSSFCSPEPFISSDYYRVSASGGPWHFFYSLMHLRFLE